jgi:hypothetical protein
MYARVFNDDNDANNNNDINVASNNHDNDANICVSPINDDTIMGGSSILNPDQCTMLCKTSFATLVSSIYACYTGNYDLAIVTGTLFLTSINYWRLPTHCWRRNVDLCVVYSTLIYQSIRAINAQYATAHYTILLTGIMCYPIGIYYYKKKQHWASTYFHSGLHIITNIANLVLYSGHIVPFSETIALFY